jgi:AraC family transcriptional regulator
MNDRHATSATVIERLSSRPNGWRRAEWGSGVFETASRSMTRTVEGRILSGNHLIMATLSGGAERHETLTDCGQRHDGPDRPASISFLPANCGRKLRLSNVAWRWAAIGLKPGMLEENAAAGLARLGPFSAMEDSFILSLLCEFDRLDALDGGLDPVYCDSMSLALALYLARRYGGVQAPAISATRLPAWRLRRVVEYVDANLDRPIRINELAALAGLSEGYFHRAFRATTGQSPLGFIQSRRVELARQLLVGGEKSIAALALETGFVSPTHFARIFRARTGKTPSEYRRAFRADV